MWIYLWNWLHVEVKLSKVDLVINNIEGNFWWRGIQHAMSDTVRYMPRTARYARYSTVCPILHAIPGTSRNGRHSTVCLAQPRVPGNWWLPRMLRVYVRFPLRLHWFILCTRCSGGTALEGGGCDQSIRSTISDAIVSSWLWLSATRSSPLGYFSRLLQVVDNWPHILW